MRNILIALLLIIVAGCSRMADQTKWMASVHPLQSATLHKIRIEQSDVTKFVGLLALEPRADGIWCILLDATGIPLIKGLVSTDGTMRVEYSVSSQLASRLPDLLGRVIEYTYFIPASPDCPWYDPYRVCFSRDDSGSIVKWRKLGPVRLWQVDKKHYKDQGETITVKMNIRSVLITLQHLDEGLGN